MRYSSLKMAVLRDFRTGLITPSLHAAVISLGVIFALGFLAIFGLPRLIASDLPPVFSRNARDHHYFVTSGILALRQNRSSHAENIPLVAIVGASVTQSSFGDETRAQAVLESVLGSPVEVRQLTSSRQNIMQMSLVLDALPPDRPTIVLLGIGPLRFAVTASEYQDRFWDQSFGFRGPNHRAILAGFALEAPEPTGFDVIDQYHFYSPRMLNPLRQFPRVLRGVDIGQNQEHYLSVSRTDAQKRRHAERVLERLEIAINDAPGTLEANYIHFRRLIEDLPGNVHPIIFDHPISPWFVQEYLGKDRFDAHVAHMRAISEETGAAYWKHDEDVHVPEQAFADWAHIASRPAQDAFRNALAARIKEVLRD